MASIVKIERGGRSIDLSGSGPLRYDDRTFRPPSSRDSNRDGTKRWSFDIHVVEDSPAAAEFQLRRLMSILSADQTEEEPIYVAYRANGYNDNHYPGEPIIGQNGAYTRYRVRSFDITLAQEYVMPLSSGVIAEATLDLDIDPVAYGKKNPVFSMVGNGITETYFEVGRQGPLIQGSAVASGSSGQPAIGTSVNNARAATDYSRQYAIDGSSSIRISPEADDYTAYAYRDASGELSTGIRYSWWLVKSSDGLEPDVRCYDNGTIRQFVSGGGVTAAKWHMGDGWWAFWIVRSITVSGAYNLGLAFGSFDTVWVGMSECNSASTSIPMIGRYQELTASATGAGVTTNRWYTPIDNAIPSSSRWSFKFDFYPYDHIYSGDSLLLSGSATGTAYPIIKLLQATVQTMTVEVRLSASNIWQGELTTLNFGTPLSIVTTFDGDTLSVYEQGSSITGSWTTGTGPAIPVVGNDLTLGPQVHTAFQGFTAWDACLTAAQVSALHEAYGPVVADALASDPVAFIWDEKTFSNEPSGTNRPWSVWGGFIGDMVELEMLLSTSGNLGSSSAGGFILGGVFSDPEDLDRAFYNDPTTGALFIPGTGTADTASYNNACEQSSVNTSAVEFVDSGVSQQLYRACAGKTFLGLVAVKDAGTDLQLRLKATYGNSTIYGPWRSVVASGGYYNFILGSITIPDKAEILGADLQLGFAVEARRTVSGAANLSVSHLCVMESPLVIDASSLDSPSSADGVLVNGREVLAVDTATSTQLSTGRTIQPSNGLMVYPNARGLVFIWSAADGVAYAPGLTTEIESARYRPLWKIV